MALIETVAERRAMLTADKWLARYGAEALTRYRKRKRKNPLVIWFLDAIGGYACSEDLRIARKYALSRIYYFGDKPLHGTPKSFE